MEDKDTSIIPNGDYCYEPLGFINGKYKIKLCTYWTKVDKSVTCSYLNESDDLLLDDQIKICNINEEL